MAKQKEHPEYQYLDLAKDILENGLKKKVYGAKTYIKSVFGRQIRFDLSKGFPLLTTKKVFIRSIIYELLWFIKGSSNIKYLADNNVHIWDDWAYKKYPYKKKLNQNDFIKKIKENPRFAKKWGELGPVYGVQWRKWPTSDKREIDQLGWVINNLKGKTPYRKHFVVSAWNPEYIYQMASSREKSVVLPPCHTLFHFNAYGNKLSLQLYQRSADLFLGVPFNIASYALLLLMVSHVTGFKPGTFVHTFGDVHIYSNHFNQIKEQLTRKPRAFPKMILNKNIKKIDDFKYSDFSLKDYNPYPSLKGEVTVVGGF